MISKRNGFSTGVVVGIIAVLIVGGAVWFGRGASEQQEVMSGSAGMEDKEGGEMSGKAGSGPAGEGTDSAMVGSAGMMSYGGAMLAGTKDMPLLDFIKADYDKAIQSDALVVLYFYANWCPFCKAEFPKMQEAFNNLPTGSKVIGFRVNYKDSETDADEVALAKEYGIAYQHTKVFIKNGERILKAPDTWDTATYTEKITGAL